MRGLDSLRLTTALNALSPRPATGRRLSPQRALAAATGADVAHHVVDPDEVLGLDPWRATELADALPDLLAAETSGWLLALPVPGALGALRGPRPLNEAALDTGEAVVAASAGVALIPYRVGPAVQWRVFAAERPRPPDTPYEAGRALRERVLSSGAALTRLEVATGSPPPEVPDLPLPPGFDPRLREAADRAARLLVVSTAALESDGGSISSYEAVARAVELRGLRDAASAALCAAASWCEAAHAPR